MKDKNSTLIGCMGLAVVFVLCFWAGPAYCRAKGTALLLQQSPVDGGSVTPAVGVHYFNLHSDITLTANPSSGYQLVYWLGDVSDPTSNRTIVYLDAPKIVIALFERVEYDFLAGSERSQSAPVGGLINSAADYVRQGYTGGGGLKSPSWPKQLKPAAELEDFSVRGGEDFPVGQQTPEPATVLLLAVGTWLVLAGRPAKDRLTGSCH